MRCLLPAFSCAALAAVALGLASCAGQEELERLRAENERLRLQLVELSGKAPEEVRLVPVPEFTVGLAAAEKSFDEQAFLTLLKDSLQAAATGESRHTLAAEDDERQIAKVRGMLVQQYLGEKKVPVRISNLTYRLPGAEHQFKVGGAVVPPSGVEVEEAGGGAVRCTFPGPLLAEMSRDRQGEYSIAFEDTAGREGQIPVVIRDVEIFDPAGGPRAARQGEVALNWELSLEKIRAYRVRGFSGDLGRFMRLMRYPRLQANINQYQTIRDSMFLFGYGPYRTGLLNRLSTPSYIDRVEVLAVTEGAYAALEPGMGEEELGRVLREAGGRWLECTYVEFSGDEKIWERPAAASFPFVSRQLSQEKGLVFYAKYDASGPVLIGDYAARSR